MKLNEIKDTNSQFFTTREEVEKWLKKMKIENYTINDDLTVDVDGDVKMGGKAFKYFPVRFGVVNGDFACIRNHLLLSLEGTPRIVKGYFDIYMAEQLESLHGSPDKVHKHFDMAGCSKVTSFTGISKYIGDELYYSDCNAKNFLALLKVKGLKYISGDWYDVQHIVKKYLPEGNIFECQQELMDAGLEEFAEL